jgi:hypothetical protein
MMSCRKHLGILLFRRRSGQHCDVHTVANYDKLPSELRGSAVRHHRRELGNCSRTGVWDDIVSWPGGGALKDVEGRTGQEDLGASPEQGENS